jgi:DNA primase
VLKERVTQTPHAALALHLMSGPHGHPEGEEEEQFQELRNILSPMMAERIGNLATEALKTYMANPLDQAAKAQYQALIERRNRLLAAPTAPGN